MTYQATEHWVRTKIGDIFTTTGGGTPSTNKKEFWGQGIPWISSADIDESGQITPRRTVTATGVEASATNPVPAHSVVVVTRVGLGKVGHAMQRLCFSQDCQALLFDPRLIDADFVAHQVRYVAKGVRGRGTTISGITVKQLHELPFLLPPFSEQERIVDALDSYFTRLDDAVASLARAQAKLKAHRTSVLKAAVEGRLVPTEASLASAERRDYEPADVLLAHILKQRRRRWEEAELAKFKTAGKSPKDDKWKRRYRDATSIDISELGQTAPKLPVGWCWASVGQMAWSVKDGPHYSPSYAEEGFPFITGGQVRPWGVDFDAAKRISLEVHRKLSARVVPEFGDLLYTKGGTTGIARVNTYEREFSVWVHVAVLKLAGLINPFYLQHALNSPWCYAQAQRFTHGVGNQDLGLTRMVKIAFPLPPRGEQDRIVEEVERLESIARESTGLVDTQLLRVKRLRLAVLKWAFEGKLADQDPNDEPAEKLLARIRAERATLAAKKVNGRRQRGAV